MIFSLEFAWKTALAYNVICKPLCRELGVTQTAFDILMFLANNPDHKTARDIVEIRHIKANLVSVNVDRLVQEGYLVRKPVKGDRRKMELNCTKKSETIIDRGHKLQDRFSESLFCSMTEETREAFFEAVKQMDKNLDEILKEEK